MGGVLGDNERGHGREEERRTQSQGNLGRDGLRFGRGGQGTEYIGLTTEKWRLGQTRLSLLWVVLARIHEIPSLNPPILESLAPIDQCLLSAWWGELTRERIWMLLHASQAHHPDSLLQAPFFEILLRTSNDIQSMPHHLFLLFLTCSPWPLLPATSSRLGGIERQDSYFLFIAPEPWLEKRAKVFGTLE